MKKCPRCNVDLGKYEYLTGLVRLNGTEIKIDKVLPVQPLICFNCKYVEFEVVFDGDIRSEIDNFSL